MKEDTNYISEDIFNPEKVFLFILERRKISKTNLGLIITTKMKIEGFRRTKGIKFNTKGVGNKRIKITLQP